MSAVKAAPLDDRSHSPAVVLSILEQDAGSALRRLAEAPRGCAFVEIRADRIPTSDIAALVRGVGRPVVVTVRAVRDGGQFDGTEEERRKRIYAALAAGADYVDVEWGGPLADLALGSEAHRVILSQHGARCALSDLLPIYRAMAATRARFLKIVPRMESADEAVAVRDLLEVAARDGRALACFAMGDSGMATRILAPSWGSWGTYGAAGAGLETAQGQLTALDLLDTYDVLGIRASTRRFALVGRPIASSPSPAMHAAGYREVGLDARYLPVEAGSLEEVLPLVGREGAFGVEAMAVTIPFKEEAARRSVLEDSCATASGAVNTVLLEGARWSGRNTDGPAALGLIRRHLDPTRARAAVVGAGGTARALAAVLRQAGAEVTLFNRDRERSERAATALGVDARGIEALAAASWDILVQATPLGRQGEEVLPSEQLQGRLVLDVVYGAEPTPLVRAARERGLAVIDGFELLVEQGLLQFELMTGLRPSRAGFEQAASSWLSARRHRKPHE